MLLESLILMGILVAPWPPSRPAPPFKNPPHPALVIRSFHTCTKECGLRRL